MSLTKLPRRPRWRWRNVPLPEPYLAALAVGIGGNLVRPLTIFPAGWRGHVSGWPLVLMGVVLAGWAVRAAEANDVAAPHRLLTTGPYRTGRNPMYLGWTSLTVGIGLTLNNAWVPALAVPAWLFLNLVTVPREERLLSERFGEAYVAYAAQVRRWL